MVPDRVYSFLLSGSFPHMHFSASPFKRDFIHGQECRAQVRPLDSR